MSDGPLIPKPVISPPKKRRPVVLMLVLAAMAAAWIIFPDPLDPFMGPVDDAILGMITIWIESQLMKRK